jgi:hypothetical protein
MNTPGAGSHGGEVVSEVGGDLAQAHSLLRAGESRSCDAGCGTSPWSLMPAAARSRRKRCWMVRNAHRLAGSSRTLPRPFAPAVTHGWKDQAWGGDGSSRTRAGCSAS